MTKILLPEKFNDRTRRNLPGLYRSSKAAICKLKAIESCRAYEARAAGVEAFAAKIHDGQLIRTARQVLCWAIRRCGELVVEEPSATGAHRKSIGGGTLSKGREALAKSKGLTRREWIRATRFAAIESKLFEEVVEDDVQIPTLEGLERLGKNAIDHLNRKAKGKKQAEGHEEGDITKRYDVIYADPPWRYEHPPIGSTSRSIENQYPTMTLDEICRLKVGTNKLPIHMLAADNAILFLWATSPKLAECMEVLTSWGFVYRTDWVWDKEKIGMGYLVRNKHETLLIAKRGELKAPSEADRPPSILRSRRTQHSAKPNIFRKWIERMYPDLDRIELFAREKHKDWDRWGFEAPPEMKEAAE